MKTRTVTVWTARTISIIAALYMILMWIEEGMNGLFSGRLEIFQLFIGLTAMIVIVLLLSFTQK